MDIITINGEEYIKKADVSALDLVGNWEHICIIATNGWIFEGYRDYDMTDDEGIQLARAHVVRSWSNGLGIGGLASADHASEYKLDEIGDIYVYADKVIAVIHLRW